MKNVRRWVLLLCAVISVSVTLDDYQVASSQKQKLKGPILVSDGDTYIFQDVGSGRVWDVKEPKNSYPPRIWSPNGCLLLIRTSTEWNILSIKGSSFKAIPQSLLGGQPPSVTVPVWSPDGRSIIFSVSLGKADTRIYSVDVEHLNSKIVFSLQEWGRILRWLSKQDLLYQTIDYLMIWNTETRKSRVFRKLPYLPTDLGSPVYLVEESPDGEMLAGYYSLPAYERLKSDTSDPADLTAEEKVLVDNTPQVSGFDIHYSNSNRRSKLHIDTYGQYLQSLAWSPSSEQVVITTDPASSKAELNGIYVYNVKTDTLRRVGKYKAMYNTEYGSWVPTWSPDEKWLAFNTPTGYIIYNLAEDREIKLSERFSGYTMYLKWSPVMDYRNTICAW